MSICAMVIIMNNTIPNNKSPPNAFYKTLKSISLLAVGSIIGYSASQYSINQNKYCLPENRTIASKNIKNNNSCPELESVIEPNIIVYSDKNAVGMKAFAENKQKVITLEIVSNGKKESIFTMPKNAFNNKDTLKVYAIDRYGKRSKTYLIYELEGILSESPFQ